MNFDLNTYGERLSLLCLKYVNGYINGSIIVQNPVGALTNVNYFNHLFKSNIFSLMVSNEVSQWERVLE